MVTRQAKEIRDLDPNAMFCVSKFNISYEASVVLFSVVDNMKFPH